jgi:hypothetical protein
MSKSIKNRMAVAGFILASLFTTIFLFSSAERQDMTWTNEQLAALKQQHGSEYLDKEDESVKEILTAGRENHANVYEDSAKWSLAFIALYLLVLIAYLVRLNRRGS